MSRAAACLLTIALFVVGVTPGAHAVRWSPSEFDIAQAPGTQETYRLTLQNDSTEPVQLRIYVADWLRSAEGVNDFSVPLNGARWHLNRTFAVGDTLTIRYVVTLPEAGLVAVRGSFRSWNPQVMEAIGGPESISADRVGESAGAPASGFVTVTRAVESVDADGLATIALEIRTVTEFDGLTIEEAFSQGVQIADIDAAGGQFDTINRSSADWVSLSYDQVNLAAEESREIVMTVTTPAVYDGMYWCILQAESRRQAVGEVQGTQIISVPSVGMKVYVSAPGSESLAGRVIDVEATLGDPLTLSASFTNTGNVQLVVTSDAQIVNQLGEVVRRLQFSEFGRDYFRVLPGSTRQITIVDYTGSDPLPEGIYQAIVSFDFGGDALVVGAKAFRIR